MCTPEYVMMNNVVFSDVTTILIDGVSALYFHPKQGTSYECFTFPSQCALQEILAEVTLTQ